MAKAGLVVAGAVITLVAVLLLTFAFHWFQMLLLFIGLGTLASGFAPMERPASTAVPDGPLRTATVPHPSDGDLRARLAELDSMRADGTLGAAEHRKKRQQIIEAWGLPPIPRP